MKIEKSLGVYLKAGQVYESYLNGNIDQLYEWIGKSQMKLTVMLEALDSFHTTGEKYEVAVKTILAGVIRRNNY